MMRDKPTENQVQNQVNGVLSFGKGGNGNSLGGLSMRINEIFFFLLDFSGSAIGGSTGRVVFWSFTA